MIIRAAAGVVAAAEPLISPQNVRSSVWRGSVSQESSDSPSSEGQVLSLRTSSVEHLSPSLKSSRFFLRSLFLSWWKLVHWSDVVVESCVLMFSQPSDSLTCSDVFESFQREKGLLC